MTALAATPKTNARRSTVRMAGDIATYRTPTAIALPSVSGGSKRGVSCGRQRQSTTINAT